MKATLFIFFALFIDGIQAAVSWGIMSIATFPGTFGGGAFGCAAGNYFIGKIGCVIGGLFLGVLGTAADPFVAPFTIPLGIVLGIAIDFCISATFGVGLIALLGFNGMFYPKYLMGGGVFELLPGFDNLPGWTAMTVLCVLENKKRKGGVVGSAASAFTSFATSGTAIGTGIGVVQALQQSRNAKVMQAGFYTEEEQATAIRASGQRVGRELQNIDGIRAATPIKNTRPQPGYAG